MADTTYHKRLRRVFEGLDDVFAPGTDHEILFGSEPDIGENREGQQCVQLPADMAAHLGVELTDRESYQTTLDLFSYLIVCQDTGSWERTADFASRFDDPAEQLLAAFVHRMVEDAYVNNSRLEQFRGLTAAYTTRIEATFCDTARYPPLPSLRHDIALLEGLRQLAITGRAHALAEAPESVQGILTWTGEQLDRARDTDDSNERAEIAGQIIETYRDELYRLATAAEYLATEIDLPFHDLDRFTSSPEQAMSKRDILLLVPIWPVVVLVIADQYVEYDLEGYVDAYADPLAEIHPVISYVALMLWPVLLCWVIANAIYSRFNIWETIVTGLSKVRGSEEDPVPEMSESDEEMGLEEIFEEIDESESLSKTERCRRHISAATDRMGRLFAPVRKRAAVVSNQVAAKYTQFKTLAAEWYASAAYKSRAVANTVLPGGWRVALPPADRTMEYDVSAYAAPRWEPQQQPAVMKPSEVATDPDTEDGGTRRAGITEHERIPSREADTIDARRSAAADTEAAVGHHDVEQSPPSGTEQLVVDVPGVDDTDTDQNPPSMIPDLATLDEKTDAELQDRQAARDRRADNNGDAEEIIQTVEELGLAKEIRRLLARFRPEVQRRTLAQTGHSLDVEALARTVGGRLGGQTEVFQQQRRRETGSRCVGVALDLSGSVDEWQAKVAVMTLGLAVSELGDDFVAAGFTGSRREVELPLITGPNEQFEPSHVGSVSAGGRTPTAAGVKELRQLMKRSHNDDRLLVVVTDGEPNSTVGVAGENAIDTTFKQIERARRDDFTVIGLGVGTIRRHTMEHLFGADGYVTISDDARELGTELLEMYQTQLRDP